MVAACPHESDAARPHATSYDTPAAAPSSRSATTDSFRAYEELLSLPTGSCQHRLAHLLEESPAPPPVPMPEQPALPARMPDVPTCHSLAASLRQCLQGVTATTTLPQDGYDGHAARYLAEAVRAREEVQRLRAMATSPDMGRDHALARVQELLDLAGASARPPPASADVRALACGALTQPA